MPALRAVYGLDWAEIESMPYRELAEHRKQLPTWIKLLAGAAGAEPGGDKPPRLPRRQRPARRAPRRR